jgi:DNA-binding CsgD family transcriptional regulator/DNA-binding XRE family transcriptional regulator
MVLMEQLDPLAPFEEPSRADFYRALGRAIKVTRAEQGLERKELSRLSGVSYPYLSEIEKGKKRPSTEAVRALASALGLRQSELLERAERALERAVPGASTAPDRAGGRLKPDAFGLTPTQQRVLELVVAGNSNAGIASRLGVSVNTVESHLQGVYSRLHVSSRMEATRLYSHDLALAGSVSDEQQLQELLVRVRRLGADDLPRVLDLVRRLTR